MGSCRTATCCCSDHGATSSPDRAPFTRCPPNGDPTIRTSTDLHLGFEGPRAIARRRPRAGEQAFCALSWGDGSLPSMFEDAHERLARTGDFCSEWISRGNFPDHPWHTHLQRSMLTLKGLIYEPTEPVDGRRSTTLPPGSDDNDRPVNRGGARRLRRTRSPGVPGAWPTGARAAPP